jgi:hypothetical protein
MYRAPCPPTPSASPRRGQSRGYYIDTGDLFHSFLRASDGTLTTFDPPGATCSLSTSNVCSVSSGINPAGAITGEYQTASKPFSVVHGFLRAPDGTLTTFDPPNSFQTIVTGINPAGAITGNYIDATTGAFHGFLRAADGTFTTFDPPSSVDTEPSAINPAGAITGFYADASGAAHGFLRRH